MTLAKIVAIAAVVSLPCTALAQGTERGADQGDRAAGPVVAVVGGAVGAATGTVGAGPGRGGCSSTTVHRENAEGDSSTTKRTDC